MSALTLKYMRKSLMTLQHCPLRKVVGLLFLYQKKMIIITFVFHKLGDVFEKSLLPL